MNDRPPEPPEKHVTEHSRRDAESAIMLGGFVVLVSIPVLIGTFFAKETHAQVVNLVAGLALLSIGAAIATWGWWTFKRLR